MSRLFDIAVNPARPNAADRQWLKQYADQFSAVVVMLAFAGVALIVAGSVVRAVLS